MNPEARAEMESRADRCLRRGEMSEALALLRELAAAFPDDAGLKGKLARVQDSLQPAELMNPKAALPKERVDPSLATPEQEGERLFALGDYAGAAAAYRRALQLKPNNALIRERLEELFRLAQAAPRHSPTDRDLPAAPEDRLRALLDRIAARKRVPK